jgi:hypothetical protein
MALWCGAGMGRGRGAIGSGVHSPCKTPFSHREKGVKLVRPWDVVWKLGAAVPTE